MGQTIFSNQLRKEHRYFLNLSKTAHHARVKIKSEARGGKRCSNNICSSLSSFLLLFASPVSSVLRPPPFLLFSFSSSLDGRTRPLLARRQRTVGEEEKKEKREGGRGEKRHLLSFLFFVFETFNSPLPPFSASAAASE